jgi:CTP synthase (UTP-ammonia lyase)
MRIALIGDYNAAVIAHRAIPLALRMAVEQLHADVSWEWLHTRTLSGDVPALLQPYAGIWCVPASPYENTAGALAAIRFARTAPRPFLGTCGGFQHAMLEYAAAECGMDAAHAETDPNVVDPIIAPLTCALVEVSGDLLLAAGSKLARSYRSERAHEDYHCSYGFNAKYENLLTGALTVAARDLDGSVRAVELADHPFFIATLFQPERAALRDQLPPLVRAFVAAVAGRT